MTEQSRVRKNSASKLKGGLLNERLEMSGIGLGNPIGYAPENSESANTSGVFTDRSGYTESASISVNHDKSHYSQDQSSIENNYHENSIDPRNESQEAHLHEFQPPMSSAFTKLRGYDGSKASVGHNPEQSSMETTKEESSSMLDQSSSQLVSDNDRSQLNVSTSSIGSMINPLAIDSPVRGRSIDEKDDASNEKKNGESALSSISSAESPGGFIPGAGEDIDMGQGVSPARKIAGSSSSSRRDRGGPDGLARVPYRHSASGFMSLFGSTAPGEENGSADVDDHAHRLTMGTGGPDASPFRRRRSEPSGSGMPLRSIRTSPTSAESSEVWPSQWEQNGIDDKDDSDPSMGPTRATQMLRFTPTAPSSTSQLRRAAGSPTPSSVMLDKSGMLSGSLSNLSVSHVRGTRKTGAKNGTSKDHIKDHMYYSSEDELPEPRGSRRPRSPVIPFGSSSFNEALGNASGTLDEMSGDQRISVGQGISVGSVTCYDSALGVAAVGDDARSTPATKGGAPTAFESIDLGTPVAVSGSPALLDLGSDNPIGDRRGSAFDAERDVVICAGSEKRGDIFRRSSGPSVFGNTGIKDGNNHEDRVTPRSKPRSRSATGAHGSIGESKHRDGSPPAPARPLPDQSAFDRNFSGRIDQIASPVCPATPMRTPTWSHDGDRSRDRSSRGSHGKGSLDSAIPPMPALMRTDSLQTNKVLSQSDALGELHGGSVDFKRDFIDEGLLGSGTFADVYRARQKEDGKLYAVKKVKRQFRSKKDRDWLLNEVRSLMGVGLTPCKYIVQFVRAWQDDGYFYVQIELAGRGTLRDLLLKSSMAKQTIPDETLWHVIHDVASGLRHIHSCGLVHLDIKPANLLIGNDGVVKIGDFGTASQVGEGEDGREGDTRYMAPELLQSSDRQPPADLFSLGLSLYEIGLPFIDAGSWQDAGQGATHGEGDAKSSLGTDKLCLNYFSSSSTSKDGSCLPLEGTLWHVLREGKADPLPGRSRPLLRVIAACMEPVATVRPLTSALLELPEVADAERGADPTLLSATSRLLAVPTAPLRVHGLPPSFSTESRCTRPGSLPKLHVDLPSLNSATDPDRAFTPTMQGGGYYFSPTFPPPTTTTTGGDTK